ncbi:hypothetical protein [Fusobacterium necrophorum]|uniref:hypothetical protein n=1 Tax=Fusobacterium necrophorum TaxID=859 RepID=UPI00370EBC23
MNISAIIMLFIFIFFLYLLIDSIHDYYSSKTIMKKLEPLSEEEKEEFVKNLSKKDQEKLLRRIEMLQRLQDIEKKEQEEILKKKRKRDRRNIIKIL